ncbi:hypothetical protein D9M68_569470 [compost metagenome]
MGAVVFCFWYVTTLFFTASYAIQFPDDENISPADAINYMADNMPAIRPGLCPADGGKN